MTAFDASIRLIESDQALVEAAAEWRSVAVVALDTEFVRESTFYPIPGLVQLGTEAGCWLLDPLRITDWSPLSEIFADQKIIKTAHACSEDLELFLLLVGTLPQPLFDTQVGAALAGHGFGLSYQALVDRLLGIAVEKDHTRSNWIARPLSEAQCHYAALDVAWLGPMYRHLASELAERERLEWWREEGERLIATAGDAVAPEAYYRKLSAGWRLRGMQVAALQALCDWRERKARQQDVPRGWLLKDHECLEIARRLPMSMAELAQVPELQPKRLREHGSTVLAILEAVRDSDPASWPEPVASPLSREESGRLKRMRNWCDARAAELGVAPEMMARKRDCEQLLRSGQLPPTLLGWRQPLVAAELLKIASGDVQ